MGHGRDTTLVRQVIAGEQVGEPVVERRSPADESDVVAVSAQATADDVTRAVDAAAEAQAAWAATPPPARGAVLLRAADILKARLESVATDLTREEGKTVIEARGEVRRAVDLLCYYGGEGWRIGGQTFPSGVAHTLTFTRREPVGVVAVITPWNFPIAIPAWKIAPALVSGNAVVFKPASMTPLSAYHLVSALGEAGLPAGVLNMIVGPGRVVGDGLVDEARVAAITFTGSVPVGRALYRRVAGRMARVQLEMGGKNPLVVLDDADVASAARIAAVGGFGLTGQACTATSRVIATPGIRGELVDALREEAARYEPGDGLDDGVLMGPVVSAEQLQTDLDFIETGRAEGGTVVAGGEPIERLLLRPTVVTDVDPASRLAREEVFGPVVAVIEASDFDEAVALANDTEFGLSAAICTTNLRAAHEFIERAQAGVVKVNRPTTGLDLNVPFGGIKASSTGTFREQGPAAIEFFTWSKSAYLGFDA